MPAIARLALLLLTACFVVPPKPHVGALPPAAVTKGHETSIGVATDTFLGLYGEDWSPMSGGRIEARYLFASPGPTADIGGFLSGAAFGFDGGVWIRTKALHKGGSRWAMRMAPSLTFGNMGGFNDISKYKLPSVGASADVQWGKRLNENVVTSVTFGFGYYQPLKTCLGDDSLDEDDYCPLPLFSLELQNRWDFGKTDKPGGWVAAGLQTVYHLPAPVLSAGVRF